MSLRSQEPTEICFSMKTLDASTQFGWTLLLFHLTVHGMKFAV
jgi:hypothetical protein